MASLEDSSGNEIAQMPEQVSQAERVEQEDVSYQEGYQRLK